MGFNIERADKPFVVKSPYKPSGDQPQAIEKLAEGLENGLRQQVLLGVTGSGKTQVYLRLVQEILSRGRRAMVLVPELVLTPQMMRRFSACFGDQVAMLHSSLRMTERYDQWKRIRRGEVQVVLGTRSAIFAPLKNVAKYLCARD